MLHKAVADPHALSVQPSSLGARFQLLLLCQKFIQSGVCDSVSEVLLRERLYASAATWFYYEPMWYHYESGKDGYTGISDGRKELQADVKLLIDFCKSLAAEKVFYSFIKEVLLMLKTKIFDTEAKASAGSVAVESRNRGMFLYL